jgi:iron complex outermembrane receptor protein
MLTLGLAALAAVTPVSDDRPTGEAETVVVVTAAPFADREGPVAEGVALIDAEAIGPASIVGGLGETLSRVPGLRSTFYGPNASRPIIRGLGEDRIRILSNGLGGIDASTVSPDHAPAADGLEAQVIEVLKGPAALRYGGNAVGGVVNVVDGRLPRALPAAPVTGSLFLGGSTAEESLAAAGHVAFSGGGGWIARLDAFTRTSEDYAIPGTVESRRLLVEEGEDPDEAERGVAPATAGEITGYGLGLAHVGARGRVAVAVRRIDATYGLPGHTHGHDHDEDEAFEDGAVARLASFASPADGEEEEEGFGRIEMEQTRADLSAALTLDGFFKEVSFDVTWGDYMHVELEPDGAVGTRFDSVGHEMRLEARHGGPAGLEGLVGAQLNHVDFEADGEEAFVPPVEIAQRGVFAIQRWTRDGWGLEGGLRLEGREYDTALLDRDFNLLSASLGVFARTAEGVRLSLEWARTERAPTEVELFANGPHAGTAAFEIGDPDLKEEVANTLELGMSWRRGSVVIGASAWRAAFDGFVAFAPTGEEEDDLPVFQIRQEDAVLTGIEASVEGDLWTVGGWTVAGRAAFDWVRGARDGGGALPRIPPSRVTLGLDARGETLRAGVELEVLGDQTRVAEFELPTDGATVVNAELGWTPPLAAGRWTLLVQGRNLGDAEVREHASFLKDLLPKPGRSLRVALRARF